MPDVPDIPDHPDINTINHAYQRLLERNERQTKILATVSHEIRAPLSNIVGITSLLGDTRLTAEQLSYVETISQTTKELLALAEDLLDIDRIESGHFIPRPTPVHVAEFCESTVELMAARAFTKHLSISCHVAACVPEHCLLEGERVRQILFNLLSNAIKFTLHGGVRLDVTHDGKTLFFRVIDNGSGIAAVMHEKIFQPHQRIENDIPTILEGAGLGLAIARDLAHAMHGKVEIETSSPFGSVFTLSLPCLDKKNIRIVEPGMRLLIASDDQMETTSLFKTLHDEGMKVSVAFSASQAAIMLESEPFDAIIMAHNFLALLPVEELRNRQPAIRSIILLQPEQRKDLADFLGQGFDAFLVRPVRRLSLQRVLQSFEHASSQSESTQKTPTSPIMPLIMPHGTQQRTLRFLIADDDSIHRYLLHRLLEKAGHDSHPIDNSLQLLDILSQPASPYDVILLDAHMPLLDSASLVASLRAQEETMKRPPIPIIILSADRRPSTRTTFLTLGANDFILKPADLRTILTISARHIAEERSSPLNKN